MDQLLEYIVPAVIFIFWIINAFMSNKNRDESETPPSQQEQDEQTRQIQEDIRRKIAERRGQQPQREPQPVAPPVRPQPSPRRQLETPPPIARPLRQEPRFERPSQQEDIFAQLAQQEQRLRESERKAQEARRHAQERITKAGPIRPPRLKRVPRVSTSLREDVIQTLRDPEAARKAVLYYEILGTPVGQRRDGQLKPVWES